MLILFVNIYNETKFQTFSQTHILWKKATEKNKKDTLTDVFWWLREKDLNLRPSGYEPDELPTAPSRDILSTSSLVLNYYSTNRFDCQAFIRKSFLLFSTFFFYKTASQLFIKSYALKYFSSRGIHFSA